jgi:RHS repeat-associated protein
VTQLRLLSTVTLLHTRVWDPNCKSSSASAGIPKITPVGNLQSYLYPNGVTTTYNYNSLNRLASLNSATGVSTLSSYTYTLGAAGNRTAVTELGGRTVNYTYDDLYRLTNETIANDSHGINGTVSYGYDPVGNRLSRTSSVAGVPSQSSTYDANDRLTADIYDPNGNTTISNGNGYSYDFENRLVSLSTQNSGLSTFLYDGDGNRVAKTINGVTTNYLVDTNNHTGYAQVVEELQGGVVAKQFTYGHDLISQRCTLPTANCSLSFYGYDGHGSVRQLTDAAATVTDAYDYDAFGNLIYRSGTTPNDYLYSGEQFDANLGLYYLRARYLNPASARFWTMDDVSGSTWDPLSLHRYLYAHSDPVNRADPSGNFDISIAGLTVSFSVQSVLLGIAGGALLSAVDRLLEGGSSSDVAKSALSGGVIGGVTAPFIGVRYLGAVLMGTGLGFTMVGAVKSTLEANYTLASFRALLFVGGSVGVLKAGLPGELASRGGGDGPLAAMLEAADASVTKLGPGSGPVYGTRAHTEFANIIKSWGDPNFRTEVTYFMGKVKPYGYPGGIRVDVVLGDLDSPRAVFDLKTGSGELTPARIQQIQQHLPGGQSVPVFEIKPSQQLSP